MSSKMMRNIANLHELAASYVLDALDPSEKTQFEEHLRQGCAACEGELRSLTKVVDEIGKSVPANPAPNPRERLRSRVSRAPQVSGILLQHSGLLISRPEEIDWQTMAPGIAYKALYQDSERRTNTSLVRMESGAYYPGHRHAGVEELFILSGDLHVEGETLHSGDYCRAESGTNHGETFTDNGCLFLLLASQGTELLGSQTP
jgi:putative transcriptional regulator